MSQTLFIAAVIAVTAGITVFLRALPFLFFSPGRKCPPIIAYIGAVLSPAAIAMLAVYCLVSPYREKSFSGGGFGIPELAASVTVVLLHWKIGNPLLSILAGTAVYMLIIQGCF